MSERWLYGWALTAIAFGGASLIVPLYVIELGGDALVLGVLFSTGAFVGVPGALVVAASVIALSLRGAIDAPNDQRGEHPATVDD